MSRQQLKPNLLKGAVKFIACSLLLWVASSPAWAVSYNSLCSTTNIDNSYTQKGTKEFDLKTLQDQLHQGGYFKSKADGKWGKRIRSALSQFCVELGMTGVKIPKSSKSNLSLELFELLYEKAKNIKPYQVCDIDTIAASFKALNLDEDLIQNLQDLLRTDGLMNGDASGAIDEGTLQGLERFCLKVAPTADAAPRETADAPTGKLAEFLENKLSGYVPESSDCEFEKIEKSYEKLRLDPEMITTLRQELVKRKFLDAANVAGTQNNPSTLSKEDLEALSKFCLEEGLEDPAIPHENLDAITGELAAFLDKKLLGTGEPGSGEETPADCGAASVEARFSHLGSRKTGEIQRFLRANGFLTDWADGVAGPQTYHALSKLCSFVESTGQLDAADPERAVIDVLAEQMKNGGLGELQDNLQQRGSKISFVATDSIASTPVAGCGCSRDFAASVYGFLPYWLADGTKHGVDFSMLDRVGIFGLQLDSMIDATPGQSKSFWRVGNKALGDFAGSDIARFINAASRHRVAVDITFYSSKWREWKLETEEEKIVDAIATAYELEFSDTSDDGDFWADLESWLRKFMPFVDRNTNVGVNGINLYFDNYTNPNDAAKISAIVTAIKERLPAVKLNLMLDPNWSGIKRADTQGRPIQLAGIDPALFSELGDLLDDESKIENLLVFLPRNTRHAEKNTSNAKKLLRRSIEDAFDGRGQTRRSVLRKTIPIVMTFADSNQSPDYFTADGGISQFGDDLIYLQDNFDGVGLWPLPLVAAPTVESNGKADDTKIDTGKSDNGDKKDAHNEGKKIASILVAQYQITPDWLKSDIWKGTGNPGDLCQFACPNRWLFRIAFDLLAAVLVIYAALAFFNCRLREIYQQKSMYFVGYGFATAMVFCVSLICDPFWQAVSDEVLVGVILALVGYLGWRKFQQSKQVKYP